MSSTDRPPKSNHTQLTLTHTTTTPQAIGIIEGHFYPGDFWTGGGERQPGAFGFDPMGFCKARKWCKDVGRRLTC